jgi:hypothetical protein
MSSFGLSAIVFGGVFGGAFLGIWVGSALPKHHLGAETKDAVKLGMGLVGTMAALVLGLLVAAAKESFDVQRTELTQMAANVALLDRLLAHYGPGAAQAREGLKSSAERALEGLWTPGASLAAAAPTAGGEMLLERIQALTPKDDAERALQSQALSLAIGIGQMRWLMFEQRRTTA